MNRRPHVLAGCTHKPCGGRVLQKGRKARKRWSTAAGEGGPGKRLTQQTHAKRRLRVLTPQRSVKARWVTILQPLPEAALVSSSAALAFPFRIRPFRTSLRENLCCEVCDAHFWHNSPTTGTSGLGRISPSADSVILRQHLSNVRCPAAVEEHAVGEPLTACATGRHAHPPAARPATAARKMDVCSKKLTGFARNVVIVIACHLSVKSPGAVVCCCIFGGRMQGIGMNMPSCPVGL